MSVYQERHVRITNVVKVHFPKFEAYDNAGAGAWTRLSYEYTLKDLINSGSAHTIHFKVSPLTTSTTYCLNSSTLISYYKKRNQPYILYTCLKKIKPKVIHTLSGAPRRITKLFRGKK